VPQSDVFDELVVPSNWDKVELPTAHQVNLRFSTIMSHHSPTSPIVVAFGIQWPIDPVTGNEGPTSLIEIAYQETVYLIKVSKHFVLLIVGDFLLTPGPFLTYI
jgi:hypothetical protein